MNTNSSNEVNIAHDNKRKIVTIIKKLLPFIILCIIFTSAHISINSYYENIVKNNHPGRTIGYSNDNNIVEVTPSSIIHRTGSLGWRFFLWGVRTDHDTLWVNMIFSLTSYDIAKATDITNPTPFMILIFFYLIPPVTRKINYKFRHNNKSSQVP